MECGNKTVISKILNIIYDGKICFVGRRVNMLEFDDKTLIKKKCANPE